MGDRWFEILRPLCEQACAAAGAGRLTDVVLFYLARWCQKRARTSEPDVGALGRAELRAVAEKIVANLSDAGERVDQLVQGDAGELGRLERLLLASARPRAGEAAPEYAREAVQRVAIVLLTGTPPSEAAKRLHEGPAGPSNEYVFHAPFSHWARRVVINLVLDERRREARAREGPSPAPSKEPAGIDLARLKDAHEALPGLLGAIRKLPPAQRSAMVLSLCRSDVDELARERLHEVAPDLLSEAEGELFASDREIAEHLATTPPAAGSQPLDRAPQARETGPALGAAPRRPFAARDHPPQGARRGDRGRRKARSGSGARWLSRSTAQGRGR